MHFHSTDTECTTKSHTQQVELHYSANIKEKDLLPNVKLHWVCIFIYFFIVMLSLKMYLVISSWFPQKNQKFFVFFLTNAQICMIFSSLKRLPKKPIQI